MGLLAGERSSSSTAAGPRTPQGWEHAAVIRALTQALGTRLDLLCAQLPVAMPTGRPEPESP